MPPAPQDPAGALVELLRRFSIEVDRFVSVFADTHRLHRTDLNAIAHIWHASRLDAPMTPGALASRLSLSPPATTALIDRLERGGYVIRTPDTADRRRTLLHGQPAAQEVALAFFQPFGQRLRGVLDGYSARELSAFQALVEDILSTTIAVADEARGNHGSDEPDPEPAAGEPRRG